MHEPRRPHPIIWVGRAVTLLLWLAGAQFLLRRSAFVQVPILLPGPAGVGPQVRVIDLPVAAYVWDVIEEAATGEVVVLWSEPHLIQVGRFGPWGRETERQRIPGEWGVASGLFHHQGRRCFLIYDPPRKLFGLVTLPGQAGGGPRVEFSRLGTREMDARIGAGRREELLRECEQWGWSAEPPEVLPGDVVGSRPAGRTKFSTTLPDLHNYLAQHPGRGRCAFAWSSGSQAQLAQMGPQGRRQVYDFSESLQNRLEPLTQGQHYVRALRLGAGTLLVSAGAWSPASPRWHTVVFRLTDGAPVFEKVVPGIAARAAD